MPPDPNGSDKDLVRRCLAGEPQAWEEFVRAHTPIIRSAIRRTAERSRCPLDSAREQDLVQETLALLSHPGDSTLRRFRWECPLPYYLAMVAAQRCLRFLRGHREAEAPPSLDPLLQDLASGDDLPIDRLAREETRQGLQAALDRLSDRDRLAVQLFYWKELPADQVGRILGVSRNAAWQILFQARQKLRALLRTLPSLLFL